jgi:hypothetical protein
MTTLQFFTGLLDWLLADPSHIVAAASALAAIIPTPDPATPLGKLYKLVDLFALNVLHAKETGMRPAAPPAAPPPTPAAPALALLLTAGLALAACADKPPATDVFGIRAGYDAAVLVPMSAYAQLPPCATAPAAPPAAGAAPVCADPNVLAQLAKADTAAKAALDAAEDVVRNHPELDSAAAIAAATDAITAATTILATYNIH